MKINVLLFTSQCEKWIFSSKFPPKVKNTNITQDFEELSQSNKQIPVL